MSDKPEKKRKHRKIELPGGVVDVGPGKSGSVRAATPEEAAKSAERKAQEGRRSPAS